MSIAKALQAPQAIKKAQPYWLGFFMLKRLITSWRRRQREQQEQQLQRGQRREQQPQARREQRRERREQQREPARERELLLSCHKR